MHASAAMKSGAIYFGAFEEAELRASTLAGVDRRAAAANILVFPQREIPAADPVHHVRQDNADVPEVTHVSRSSIRLLDSHDANENGLTHAQTSFAPGANPHD